MGILNALFGKWTDSVADYIEREAVILDVRSNSEFQSGHIENAKHIPIQELGGRINEIKLLNKPVIAYCKSGVRSARAARLLKYNGIDAINGGGIGSMKRKIRS